MPLLAVPAGRSSTPLHFVNPLVDWLLIGGLSILAFLGMGLLERQAGGSQAWLLQVATLSWICNWPHFAATSYRLYHSKANIAQYPLTALALPIVLLGAIAASFVSPHGVAPWLVKMFLIWSPYHYSGQSVGISLIYARRSGVVFGRIERLALAGFIFGTFLVQTVRSEVDATTRTFYAISYPTFGLPPVFVHITEWMMYASGAVLLVCLVRWSLRSGRWLPPLILLPAATQFVWFVLGWRVRSFYEFVPFFHGMQYLLIAWAMQLKETADVGGVPWSRQFVWGESLRWGLTIFVGGIGLFWLLPRVAAAGGLSLHVAEPIVISAIQIHHFFVDGVIWKLRNPRVGSPLLVNIPQLTRGVHVQPA